MRGGGGGGRHDSVWCLMFGHHLGFLKQRKVGERKKFLPRGWLIDDRKERLRRGRGKKNTS